MACGRILLIVRGSRGDAQPFVALCRKLQHADFAVRVLTDPDHVPMFSHAGISAVGSGDYSVETTLREDPKLLASMKKGDLAGIAKGLEKFKKTMYPPMLKITLNEIRTFRPDVITSGGMDMWDTQAIANGWDIPFVYTGLQTTAPSQFRTSIFGEPEWAPGRLKLALGTLALYLLHNGDQNAKLPAIQQQCPEVVPFLPDFSQFMLNNIFHPPAQPLIFESASLHPWQPDWPEAYSPIYTGACCVEPEVQAKMMDESVPEWGGDDKGRIKAFLETGKPPVYMGWGSMISVSSEHMAQLAVRALMQLGERGIVLGGFAGLAEAMLDGQPDSAEMRAYAERHVLFVKAAPHEVVFPRCAVIVHHGGAGTTNAALRSGTPSVVTPVWLDQYQNSLTIQEQGVGIRARQCSKVSVEELSSAVRSCLEDKAMQARACDLAAQLRAEDGPAAAVAEIKRFLDDDVASGRYAARVSERRDQMEALRARRSPGCLAWIARIFCSGNPNDYWVPPPGAKKASE